jgi:phage-related protein
MKRPQDSAPHSSTTRGTLAGGGLKRVSAIFFKTAGGNEPVRDWLRSMPRQDRRLIGEDIKTAEYGWPVGMPICRSMGRGLNEVRTTLTGNRIARVFFYIDRNQRMVLLHGIVKKSQATPEGDLALARKNMALHERGLE